MELTKTSNKTSTGQAAVIMGATSVGLGIVMCFLFRHQLLCMGVFLVVIAANAVLHLACLKANHAGSPATGLLIMTVAECGTVSLSLISFVLLEREDAFLTASTVFAFYLIMNGAALMAIPSALSRKFGCSSIGIGCLMFLTGVCWQDYVGLAVAFSLAVNSSERLVMSLSSRKS